MMFQNATFVSVWDGGYKCESKAKVNTETNEILIEEHFEDIDDLNICDEEYVVVNGIKFHALPKTEWENLDDESEFSKEILKEKCFWYE